MRICLTLDKTKSAPYISKMFKPTILPMSGDKQDLYDSLAQQLSGLLAGEPDAIANAANMSALLFDLLPDLNWAGFYFMRGSELVLGPFQGKPACIRIAVGRGVCGTAVERKASIVVPDVHAFPGHIACDSASRSELVVPLIKDGQVLGVLDLDSPNPARFDDADREGCEKLVQIYLDASKIFESRIGS
jgi:L-methionine (R)-S-oxide reductase